MNKLVAIAIFTAAGLAGCATPPGAAAVAQVQTDCSATRASPAQRWRAVPARSCAIRAEVR
jgi:hypothetical protein